MTLATAVAIRSAEADLLITLSDSRLTLGNEGSRRTDTAIKSFGLGPKSAILMAGSTLPMTTAIEGARGLIANANALKELEGKSHITILEEARLFAGFFDHCCRALDDGYVDSHGLIAGFCADRVPAIVRLSYSKGTLSVDLFRPRPGDFAIVSIGDPYFAGIATEAIARKLATSPKAQVLVDDAGSTFWDVACHNGAPGIGGGLALGLCRKEHSCWQWPVITIDHSSFYRGLRLAQVPEEWRATVISLSHNPHIFGSVEAEQPPRGFALEYPKVMTKGFGGFADWTPTAEEAASFGPSH